jgi:BirA family biotin operon repressor/biotin-[acetyl-CoA-carboxylase] ligase
VTLAATFLSRRERFARVSSTNDVVHDWLAGGTPEVCLAVADEQMAGRGRDGRTWVAPPGAALLLSAGFRPTWLAPDRVWRLPATVSLAMAEAGEEVARLPAGSIGLKWPNDLVMIDGRRDAELALASPKAKATLPRAIRLRKLGGVLGETDGLGTLDPRAVVGIGVNADWPAASFPPELATTMTSLRELAGDRPIDTVALLEAFVERLGVRIDALRDGQFDSRSWIDRQATTGRSIELVDHDGASRQQSAVGVDPETGALRVADAAAPDGERQVLVGEIRHIRLPGRPTAGPIVRRTAGPSSGTGR